MNYCILTYSYHIIFEGDLLVVLWVPFPTQIFSQLSLCKKYFLKFSVCLANVSIYGLGKYFMESDKLLNN